MRYIVDTNVAVVANGNSPQADTPCVVSCIKLLLCIEQNGKIVLDSDWLILREYQDNLSPTGQPGVGDAFLYWVLQNWKNPAVSEIHLLDLKDASPNNFLAFPDSPKLTGFDASDHKFVALAVVANASIFTAVDQDFWDYREAMEEHGIVINFVCPGQFN